MSKDGINISDSPDGFERPSSPPPAPPSSPLQTEPLCPACKGSGEGWALSDSSPDGHFVQVTCGECSGSGTLLGAYETAKVQRESLYKRLNDAGRDLLFMRTARDGFEAMADGLRLDAERYRWIRHRNLDTISQGGVFAGITPQNLVINEETLDEAVDAAMAKECGQ
ncbi:hypothetical protein GEV39_15115 [Pseudomonas sp. NY5710]|uniref:hypothetical protein n=1 Tax=Pseudomonas sp. NY5710 TaxID=2662033 RepID=UPI001570B7AA|nr:hypothetical protein [Pseudomonas sp. NY5710]QKL02641.1 hypothetical protein GEV39_15115 [Pseudomonas sp. NY5710]